jgi:hypothetical protein
MSESEETREDRYADVDTSHLDDVEDGCGCTEIWEHTSDAAERSEATEEASQSDENATDGE